MWSMSSRFEDLDKAEDLCVLVKTHQNMQEKIRQLIHHAGKAGLQISDNGQKPKNRIPKTKLVFTPPNKFWQKSARKLRFQFSTLT